jgi:hypothetical protein
LTDEQKFFTDFWNFRKKFYDPKDTESFWHSFMEEGDALGLKYKDSDFFQNLMLLEFEDVDRRFQDKHGRSWKSDAVEHLYKKIKERRK